MAGSYASLDSASGLTNDALRRVAPSIFATQPWGDVSSRYKFIPTAEVVDILRDKSFVPTWVAQSKTRIPGKGEFTKHMLRFRHLDFLNVMQGEVPELVLTNSHDKSGAFNFMSGVFRMICGNGMICQSDDFGSVKVRHVGGNDFHDRVIDATFQVVEQAPKVAQRIGEWKQIQLNSPQQLAFANAANELLDKPLDVHQLIQPRRVEDAAPTLWNVTNRIQENLMRGGIKGRSEKGRRTKTRPITAVDRNVSINKAVWRLGEEMAKLINSN